jgi:hypothetical protein
MHNLFKKSCIQRGRDFLFTPYFKIGYPPTTPPFLF